MCTPAGDLRPLVVDLDPLVAGLHQDPPVKGHGRPEEVGLGAPKVDQEQSRHGTEHCDQVECPPLALQIQDVRRRAQYDKGRAAAHRPQQRNGEGPLVDVGYIDGHEHTLESML